MLTAYGIQTEQSHIRIHVCVQARRVYLYETRAALDAIATGKYRQAPAYTHGQRTALGYLVPPKEIANCRSINVPRDWFSAFDERDTPSRKGEKATELVAKLARCYGLPVPSPIRIETDTRQQLAGIDAVLSPSPQRLQIKCDWSGGDTAYGGSGHLYIQIAESNPFHQH